MGLGYDAKSKSLSIAMIVLGLVCLLMLILTVQLKKKIILIPSAIILIGYIVTLALLVTHYNKLMKEDPNCAMINGRLMSSDCKINGTKIFVLAGGIISTLILGTMLLVFSGVNTL